MAGMSNRPPATGRGGGDGKAGVGWNEVGMGVAGIATVGISRVADGGAGVTAVGISHVADGDVKAGWVRAGDGPRVRVVVGSGVLVGRVGKVGIARAEGTAVAVVVGRGRIVPTCSLSGRMVRRGLVTNMLATRMATAIPKSE